MCFVGNSSPRGILAPRAAAAQSAAALPPSARLPPPQRRSSLLRLLKRRPTSPGVELFLLSLIIEEFQKCHLDHPVKKFFGECTDLKIKLDRCFRQEKALKRKANFEESKKFKEQLQAYKTEIAEKSEE